METAPEGDTSSTSMSRKEVWRKSALISTNSVNPIPVFSVSVVVTVLGVLPNGGGITVADLEAMLVFSKGGTLVHPLAKSTAALASTTPNPYSWLK